MAQTFSNRSAASTMNGCEAKVVAGNAMAPRKLSLDRRREKKLLLFSAKKIYI